MRLWICKKRCESLKVDENEFEKICEIQEEECGGFYSRGRNRTNAPTSSLVLSFPFLIRIRSQLRLGVAEFGNSSHTQKLVMHN